MTLPARKPWTVASAKDCVRNSYPKAVAIYSARHNGVFIRETRYLLSRIIGPEIAAETDTAAWKQVAEGLFQGTMK